MAGQRKGTKEKTKLVVTYGFSKRRQCFSWDKSKCSKGIKSRRKREQHMERQGSIEAHGTLRALFRKQKQWVPERDGKRWSWTIINNLDAFKLRSLFHFKDNVKRNYK